MALSDYIYVPPSHIPVRMRTYLENQSKRDKKRSELGLVVNGIVLRCISENGVVSYSKKNSCLIVKSKSKKSVTTLKSEISALKNEQASRLSIQKAFEGDTQLAIVQLNNSPIHDPSSNLIGMEQPDIGDDLKISSAPVFASRNLSYEDCLVTIYTKVWIFIGKCVVYLVFMAVVVRPISRYKRRKQ
jgi:hypothetical protein